MRRLSRVLLGLVLVSSAIALPSASLAQIAGGTPIDIKDAPWQVALRIKSGAGFALCGGTVIDPRWVLTAAHCLPGGVLPQDIQVITGTSDYLNGGRWVGIRDVIVHTDYEPATNAADLALMYLVAPIDGVFITTADVSLALRPGEPLFVSGWGAIAEGGQKSRQLMGAIVPYVENPACNAPRLLCRSRAAYHALRRRGLRRRRRVSGRQRRSARIARPGGQRPRRCRLVRCWLR